MNRAPEIPKVLEDPVVTTIAQKYGKTPAQVLLRHLVQQNVVVIPKSTTLHRIQENFEVYMMRQLYIFLKLS